MIRLTELLGQQSIALASAERTGTVTGVVLDHHQIVAVGVGDVTIPAGAVRSFEGDVLTYDADLPPIDDRPTIKPLGQRVLDTRGDQLGTIDDLEISATGAVETVVLDTGDRLNGIRLRSIGRYAAILAEDLPPPIGSPTNP